MLKITRVQHDLGTSQWKLEGSLVGAWVDELRQIAEESLIRDETVVLDLSEVGFVDSTGAALLRQLADRQVRFERPTMFIRELLQGGLS